MTAPDEQRPRILDDGTIDRLENEAQHAISSAGAHCDGPPDWCIEVVSLCSDLRDARAELAALRERFENLQRGVNGPLSDQLDALRERAETAGRERLEIIGIVQRWQPEGSPPPLGARDLVFWIMRTLDDRANNALERLGEALEAQRLMDTESGEKIERAESSLRECREALADAVRVAEQAMASVRGMTVEKQAIIKAEYDRDRMYDDRLFIAMPGSAWVEDWMPRLERARRALSAAPTPQEGSR